jgi:CheY-like chemotaxis protein
MTEPGMTARPQVLHVEDDPACAELVRLALAPDYEVVTAGDGWRALQLIEERRPDLVLLDLDLPRLGGLELVRRLRQLPEAARVPIVVLSGRVMQDEAETTRAAGCQAFQEKPFSLDELRKLIATTLGRGAGSPAGSGAPA